MSGFQTIDATCRPEQSTVRIVGTITDDAGAAIPLASLTTLTLWLYHRRTGAIIGARDGQDIKGVNGGSVDSAGVLTLTLGPSDTVLESQALATSDIEAEIEWTYNGGNSTGRALVRFTVGNLTKTT